jgi:hypothetical protein
MHFFNRRTWQINSNFAASFSVDVETRTGTCKWRGDEAKSRPGQSVLFDPDNCTTANRCHFLLGLPPPQPSGKSAFCREPKPICRASGAGERKSDVSRSTKSEAERNRRGLLAWRLCLLVALQLHPGALSVSQQPARGAHKVLFAVLLCTLSLTPEQRVRVERREETVFTFAQPSSGRRH